jgi:hypothetical protein
MFKISDDWFSWMAPHVPVSPFGPFWMHSTIFRKWHDSGKLHEFWESSLQASVYPNRRSLFDAEVLVVASRGPPMPASCSGLS